MPIHWTEFDWPSFSTLAAGAMAVGAAIFVGIRQAAIARRQNEILASQTALAELTLRHEMFERRYQIYETVSKALGVIVREGAAPPLSEHYELINAIHMSRFLFAPKVHDDLDAIWKRVATFRATHLQNDSMAKQGKQPNSEQIEKQHEQFQAISDDLHGLPDLFGDELRLSPQARAKLRIEQ